MRVEKQYLCSIIMKRDGKEVGWHEGFASGYTDAEIEYYARQQTADWFRDQLRQNDIPPFEGWCVGTCALA